MSSVVLPRKTFNAVAKLVREEIERLRQELTVVIEELKMLEDKYGVPSNVFLEMLRGSREWSLPEGSEPDVVEWEAILEQKERIEKKLRELEELWNQLQGYSRS